MKRLLAMATLFVLSAAGCTSSSQNPLGEAPPPGERLPFRVLATGLADPWEITWGPDGFLWVTEKAGKAVTRVNPANGSKTTVLTIADAYASGSQDGLLGMAFQPNFLKERENSGVYLAYTYDVSPNAAVDRRTKIVRYTYDPAVHALTNPADVLSGLPASSDHNSGRLLLGPDQKLYYSIGDQGNNQFERFCNPIRAQDLPTVGDVGVRNWDTYVGKILRLNLDFPVSETTKPIRTRIGRHRPRRRVPACGTTILPSRPQFLSKGRPHGAVRTMLSR